VRTGSAGPVVVLVRHGETEWSRNGQHTGRTDVDLTAAGVEQARATTALIRTVLGGEDPVRVISSPRRRALRTAELAGYRPDEVTEAAAEWDYGTLEGLTSDQIAQRYPDWSIWSGPVPGGEDAAAVSARFDNLLDEISVYRDLGTTLVFSHGHAIRCLAARWLREPITAGRNYALATGAVSALGLEHGRPVIVRWNLDGSLLDQPLED
jgi:broad specificity phosphatase PhoE